jgi:hypothetical protein
MFILRRELLRRGLFLGAWLSCAFSFSVFGRAARATEVPQANAAVEHPVVGSHWGIAPQFSISLPQPFQVGVELWRSSRREWRGFSELGYLRLPLTGGEKSLRAFSSQVGIRFFPGDQWYFLLGSLGYRYFGISADMSAFRLEDQVLASQGAVSLHTLFVRLAVGGDFYVSSRLLLGFDVGYQLALLGAARMELSDAETGVSSANSELLAVDSSPIRRIAKLGLPQVTLVRLTWLLE